MGKLAIATACGYLLAASAMADSWDKKTILTVSETVSVPGKTLVPGKYVLKLVESQSNRHIVRIMNEREDEVITTVLAIPNWRLKPTGDTQFMFWETPVGNPPALRAWFYPGDNFGQEFAYPKGLAAKIAEVTTAPVPAFPFEQVPQEAELATAPVAPVERPREPAVVAQAVPPPATPAVAAPEPAPAELPKTGSQAPLVALGGFAALALGIALRHVIRSVQA